MEILKYIRKGKDPDMIIKKSEKVNGWYFYEFRGNPFLHPPDIEVEFPSLELRIMLEINSRALTEVRDLRKRLENHVKDFS